jgi:hypothetical protein
MRPIPPNDMDGITTGVAIEIKVEAFRGFERRVRKMQVRPSCGEIAYGAFDDAIADYGPCHFKAITPGV